MDKTYCIFGDSVTHASYVHIGWVELLKHFLEKKYSGDFIHVFNLGIGGNTTEDILKRFEAESSVRMPTTIIFAVGINDTKLDNLVQFRKNLEKLIGLTHKFTPDITFMGLVLGDWKGEEPFSREKTTVYNQAMKEIAESHACTYIQLQEKLGPEDFMDGLHSNDQGHRKMFEEIQKYF